MCSRLRLSHLLGVGVAAISLLVNAAAGQSTRVKLEVRPFVGVYIPTGDQRRDLEDAVLTGGQLSWHVIPSVNITGALGWSPSKDRVGAVNQTLDIVQYDIGAELRGASLYPSAPWDFTPFVGLGIGGRNYSYRDLGVDSKSVVNGYAALGADFGLGPFGIRIEARDYVSRFKPLVGTGDWRTRNDIGIVGGLAFQFP